MARVVKAQRPCRRRWAERALIGQSRHPAMVCLGSVGIGRIARKVLGSNADALARQSYCPVSIMRCESEAGESDSGYVAVVVDDSRADDAVLEHGLQEARLRQAPILAMGVWRWGVGEIPYRQLGPWVARYPEIHVQPTAARRGAAEFLAHTQESVQVAAVGGGDAGKVAKMIGPTIRHLSGRAGCSVIVVRG